MKNFKKILAIILAAIMLVGSFAVTSFAAPSSKDRYSVLVLDCSGSMYGKPLEALKKGAKAFCDQVLSSNRNSNKIAIVTFEDYATVLAEFSNDKTALDEAIDSIVDGDMTNLADGLSKAKTLLESVSGDVIKNIVVMCDGYPNYGGGEAGAYNVIKSIPLHWNIYGLYYCQNGYNANAEIVMQNVGRNGYTKVEDDSALTFSFIDNGTTITTKSVNNVVIHIACPVDVSVTLNGVTLDKNNPQTTFGTLEFEGENDEIKILKLAYRNDYIIDIVGTGDGTMDYDISYYCNDDQLYNLDYPTVDITPATHIVTGVDVDDSSITLDIDSDGDGEIDENVSANASTSNFWYRIKEFFNELFYKIKEFFRNIFSFSF